jgi:hypothetical protein
MHFFKPKAALPFKTTKGFSSLQTFIPRLVNSFKHTHVSNFDEPFTRLETPSNTPYRHRKTLR